jgi:hypothetical protein
MSVFNCNITFKKVKGNSLVSTKNKFVAHKFIDKFNNILDLNKFREANTETSIQASKKIGRDVRVYYEINNGKKAVPNNNVFKEIDLLNKKPLLEDSKIDEYKESELYQNINDFIQNDVVSYYIYKNMKQHLNKYPEELLSGLVSVMSLNDYNSFKKFMISKNFDDINLYGNESLFSENLSILDEDYLHELLADITSQNIHNSHRIHKFDDEIFSEDSDLLDESVKGSFKEEMLTDEQIQEAFEQNKVKKLYENVSPLIRKTQNNLFKIWVQSKKSGRDKNFTNQIFSLRNELKEKDILKAFKNFILSSNVYVNKITNEVKSIEKSIEDGDEMNFEDAFSKLENIRLWLKSYSTLESISTMIKINIDYKEEVELMLRTKLKSLGVPIDDFNSEDSNFLRYLDNKYNVNISSQVSRYNSSSIITLNNLQNEFRNLISSINETNPVDKQINGDEFIKETTDFLSELEVKSVGADISYIISQNRKLLNRYKATLKQVSVKFLHNHNEIHNSEMEKKGHHVLSEKEIAEILETLPEDISFAAMTWGVPRQTGDVVVDSIANYYANLLNSLHREKIGFQNKLLTLYNKYNTEGKSQEEFFKKYLKLITINQKVKKVENKKLVLDENGKAIYEVVPIKYWVFHKEYDEFRFANDLQTMRERIEIESEEKFKNRINELNRHEEIINEYLLDKDNIVSGNRILTDNDKKTLEDITGMEFSGFNKFVYEQMLTSIKDINRERTLIGDDKENYIKKNKNILLSSFYKNSTKLLSKESIEKLTLDKFKSMDYNEFTEWYNDNTKEMSFNSASQLFKFIRNNKELIAFNDYSVNNEDKKTILEYSEKIKKLTDKKEIDELSKKIINIINKNGNKKYDLLINNGNLKFTLRIYSGEFISLDDKYKNTSKEYLDIKDDEMYKFLIDSYNEYNSKLPKKLMYGMIPQYYKESKKPFYDKDKTLRENLYDKTFKSVESDFTEKEIEEEYGHNVTDIDGNLVSEIPISGYKRIKEPEYVDLDLLNVMSRFQQSTNKYINLRKNVDIYNSFKVLFNGDNFLGIEARNAIYRNPLGKEEIVNKITKEKRKKREVRTQQGLAYFMDNLLYGIEQEESTFKVRNTVYDTGKVVKKALKYSSITLLAWNLNASIENMGVGNLAMLKEAIGGKRYTLKEFKEANAEMVKYSTSSTGLMRDVSNVDMTKKSKISQIFMLLDVIQGTFIDEKGIVVKKSLTERIFNSNILFFNQHVAEFQIQMTGAIALMKKYKVDLEEGYVYNKELNKIERASKEVLDKYESDKNKVIYKYNRILDKFNKELLNETNEKKIESINKSIKTATTNRGIELEEIKYNKVAFWDGFEQDVNGILKIKDVLSPYITQSTITEVTNHIHAHNTIIHGNYSKLDKSMSEYKWYGQLAIMFRKHVYSNFNNRFGKSTTNFQNHDIDEGYWRTTLNKIAKDYNAYKWYAFKKLFDGSATVNEKVAIRKVITELSIIGTLSLLFMMVKAITDDDDDKLAFLKLHLKRLYDSEALWTFVFSPYAVVRQFRSPTVMLNIYDRWGTFLLQLFSNPFETYENDTAYNSEGDSKLFGSLKKALPVIRPIQNLMNPKEVLKYYINSSRM